MAQQARRPQHADAVGHTQVGAAQNGGKGRITVRVDDEFGVDGADLVTGGEEWLMVNGE